MASALHILDLEIASSLRCQRVFRDRLNPLDEYSDGESIVRYRITRNIFMELLNAILSKLFQSTTRFHSIPPTTQLAVALQFLAGVSLQCVMAYPRILSSHGGFPLVFGCIDGSLVVITVPAFNEEMYVNPKLFHSINIQAICDHEFLFIDSVVMWAGSTHDTFIWRQSAANEKISNALYQQFMDGYWVIVRMD
ncbi:nuclease HARBI1 [Oopsacas minuta]|uniref:Nuclease HARBI1 n=1 Tax=Oopsacas minuta TaxID=111878 RepID=A0AAV7KQC2_9METZ|nr:nuclease HARBI1 [Oopsacas minuta]